MTSGEIGLSGGFSWCVAKDDATTEVIWTGVVIGAFISWVLTEVQESSFKAKAVEGTIDTE